MRRINWFGLAAGIIILILLIVSFYVPWWTLTLGQNLIKVNASPVYTNFAVFGSQFTIPLIWASNIVGILTLAASGIVLLVYSLMPAKPYSKQLLGFSYKKPIYVLISFVVVLIVVISIAGFMGLSVPILGSGNLALPNQFMPTGLTISGTLSASFQLPFWLCIVAVGLCVAARFYHGRAAKPPEMVPIAQA